MARVELNKGNRWRDYASKAVSWLQGSWERRRGVGSRGAEMKAKFPLSLGKRLSASPASSSLRERLSIQTDPLQTDFSVDLTCFAARHAPYCGGLLCVGASCCCASCATQSTPLFLELSTNQFFFFVLAAGERGWRSRPSFLK